MQYFLWRSFRNIWRK